MTLQFIERWHARPNTGAFPDVDPRDVQAVRRWLRNHEGGGWLQCDDTVREETAKRLIFVRGLAERGEVSDDR